METADVASEPKVIGTYLGEPVTAKPRPSLPAGWPTVPPAFGPGWIALPNPFGQVPRDGRIAACGDCGRTVFTMYFHVKGVRSLDKKSSSYYLETSVACPECIAIPDDAIVVGEFDCEAATYRLYGNVSGQS